jgi:hypothetical protein
MSAQRVNGVNFELSIGFAGAELNEIFPRGRKSEAGKARPSGNDS